MLALLLANSRTPALRRGDFRAQVAANQRAATRLAELIDRQGRDTVLAAFDAVIDHAERRARAVLRITARTGRTGPRASSKATA